MKKARAITAGLLWLAVSLSAQVITNQPGSGGPCTLTGTQTTGYILTATNNGTGCQWQTNGGASVDANTVKNAIFLTDGGTANAVTGTTTTAFPGAYASGQAVIFTANATNTTATTININSLGNKNLTKNGATALAAGNKVSGTVYLAVYDGTQFELINFTLLAADIPALTYLVPSNNLSDVGSAATARSNLGLGSAATQNTGTSGATLCLLNAAACGFSNSPTGPAPAQNDNSTKLAPTSYVDLAVSNSGALRFLISNNLSEGNAATMRTNLGFGNLTSNAVLKGQGTNFPLASGCTIDGSNNLTCPGSVTSGSGSGAAGALDIGQGTLPALGTTSISLLGPASVTSYGLLYPGTAPAANQFLLWGNPASGISTGVFTGFTSTNLTDTSNLVRNQGTNTGTSAMTLDMSASSSAAAFRLPNLAGASSTTAGVVSYDTTNKNVHFGGNGVDNIIPAVPSASVPVNGNCTKFSVVSNVVTLADAGAVCGTGGGGVTSVNTLTGAVALFAANPQTGTYQVLAADFSACKTITVASGTFTITLVASGSQPPSGQCIDVINYGTGVVTLARSGQNINGAAANLTGTAGSATAPTGWHVVSDGTNYVASVWATPAGGAQTGIVCASEVDTDQSTASSTYTDLATADTCTFTLAATSTVIIEYSADGYATAGGSGNADSNIVNIAGSDVVGTDGIVTYVCTTCEGRNFAGYIKSGLGAGSQTVKIRHKVASGSHTAHWLNRVLKVTIVSVP
jgi:hypothetical protein